VLTGVSVGVHLHNKQKELTAAKTADETKSPVAGEPK
jgi:hypothetical protein